MRRLLTGPWAYAVELAGAARRGWDAFFFRPADPTPLGLIRVAVGLLLLWNMVVYGLDLPAFLGSDGWADPSSLRALMAGRTPWAWSFWFLVPDAMLRPVWVACLVVLALFTVGLWTRVTSVLTWLAAVSYIHRTQQVLFGMDTMMNILLFYLMIGNSGAAMSVDRVINRYRAVRASMRRSGALDSAKIGRAHV